ncbi:EI24 domain-containing protein [Roseobacter sp. YSTF-M11]|uniref:EI24 domain-containing protein n=1 Tax=Roseobacter insulae TaxID=2859783 RepID=A0A9X1FRE3_9RHOB|nr:EI24 domain-containing protein [Roseobacter insulae]MBW4706262.1 EI24 domain-containing protein [Roseobacter insulae]
MILTAFFAALGQITDPRFRRVLLLGIGLTFVLLVAVSAGFVWLLSGLVGDQTTLPFIGEVHWLNDLVSWGSAFLLAVLSVFLMVPVAAAITSIFLDAVAQAVEDEHYPHLPRAASVPIADALRDMVNFLGVLIGANLLALILYILFAPAAPLIFWGLNGFLLGREYFTLAAMRRVGRAQAKQMRSRHMITIWIAGVLMAIPLSVPLLNLVIPILGAATFTHLFHLLQGQAHRG